MVCFERKKKQCMMGAILWEINSPSQGIHFQVPEGVEGSWIQLPAVPCFSSSEKHPSLKSRSQKKIIHTKNKLCHESFDFAFPWTHSLCVERAKVKGHLICFRLAEPWFKEFYIQFVPIGPHGLNQGWCWWGLTNCYFCCSGIGVWLCTSFIKMTGISLVQDSEVLGLSASPHSSYSEWTCAT